jgi:hypothetical protein
MIGTIGRRREVSLPLPAQVCGWKGVVDGRQGSIATEERSVSRGEASSGRERGSGAMSTARRWLEPALLVTTTALLAAGGVAWLAGSSGWAGALWAAATVAAVVPAVGWVVAALLRRTLGVDVIAVLALLGTLAVGE